MKLFSPVNERTKLFVRITAQITQAIEEGRYKPGDKLPSEHQLAEQFSVSRTVVREAMQSLAGRGIVDIRRGVGAFVTAVTPDDKHLTVLEDTLYRHKERLLELFQVRRILEEEVVRQAAKRATPADIRKLEKIIDAAEKAARHPDTGYVKLNEFNAAFHGVLLEITNNNTLKHIMNSLIDILRESREITLQLPGRYLVSVSEHKEILEAVRNGDEERAIRAMGAHLKAVEDTIQGTARNRKGPRTEAL